MGRSPGRPDRLKILFFEPVRIVAGPDGGMTHSLASLIVLVVLASGCGYRSSTLLSDPGSDGGTRDTGARDATTPIDSTARDGGVDAGPGDAGPEETRLANELACRLDHDTALDAAARAAACAPDTRGSMRSYFEAWEAGLLGTPVLFHGLTGFDYEWGCDAWRCIASATSCEAFDTCLADSVRGGPCVGGSTRCNGDLYEVCRSDGSGYSVGFDCATLGATCTADEACVISDTCSFGMYHYELDCLDGDLVLCDGLERTSCDAWHPGSSCASFAISGEVPTVWCSPTGENGYGAYAESRVTCTAGTVSFTSATSVSATYDCLANGYSGCNERGCVP